jgi:hypothetical protein
MPRQITCLYDMDIPRPDNFNETYLYEGKPTTERWHNIWSGILCADETPQS